MVGRALRLKKFENLRIYKGKQLETLKKLENSESLKSSENLKMLKSRKSMKLCKIEKIDKQQHTKTYEDVGAQAA